MKDRTKGASAEGPEKKSRKEAEMREGTAVGRQDRLSCLAAVSREAQTELGSGLPVTYIASPPSFTYLLIHAWRLLHNCSTLSTFHGYVRLRLSR